MFTFNASSYPNPERLFSKVSNVICNVKPWLLKSSPRYVCVFLYSPLNELTYFCIFFHYHRIDILVYTIIPHNDPSVNTTCFFIHLMFTNQISSPIRYDHTLCLHNTSSKSPKIDYFWKGGQGTFSPGSFIDFTSSKGYLWWKTQVHALLSRGARGVWNDNNEFELVDLHHTSLKSVGRAYMSYLMAKSSFEAFQSLDLVPFVVSRAGSIGTHRYAAHTWSGDNTSSWKSLQFNIPMMLGLSMSGWVGAGFDVGGFAGEKPSEELFLRWVQVGVFCPRFSIHSSSWKEEVGSSIKEEIGSSTKEASMKHQSSSIPDEEHCTKHPKMTTPSQPISNEPWMYPSILPQVQQNLNLRVLLMGYIHTLFLAHQLDMSSIVSPLMHNVTPSVSHSPRLYNESFQFYLGDLMVVPIYSPGQSQVSVYFPPSPGMWWSPNYDTMHGADKEETIELVERINPLDDFHLNTPLPLFLPPGGFFHLENSNGDVCVCLSHSSILSTTSIQNNNNKSMFVAESRCRVTIT